MNGLPLPDISNPSNVYNVSEIINTDPLVLINQNHKQQMELSQQQYSQSYTGLSRDTDYKLRILERQYDIDYKALEERFYRLEPTEDNRRRAADAVIQLNAAYTKEMADIRGKIQPDLDKLKMQQDSAEQKMEMDRAEKIKYIQLIRQLQEQGIISNPAAAMKAQFQIAGINLPMTAFQQPDPTKELVMLGMQAANLEKQRKYQGADAIRRRMAEITGKVSPDVVSGTKNATRFSGLEGRRKRRQVEKEGPGTLAEGIIQVKNKTLGAGKYTSMPMSGRWPKAEKEKPIYQRDRTTGQIRVSYDGGKTWQVIG